MNLSHHPGDARGRERTLDELFARYVDAYHAGTAPDLRALLLHLRHHPESAREVFDFVLYFHAIGKDLPEPDPVPIAPLSPAAQRALEIIRHEVAEVTREDGLASDERQPTPDRSDSSPRTGEV